MTRTDNESHDVKAEEEEREEEREEREEREEVEYTTRPAPEAAEEDEDCEGRLGKLVLPPVGRGREGLHRVLPPNQIIKYIFNTHAV